MTPNTVGQITLGKGDIEAFQNRKSIKMKVNNTGDRGIQVGSHFHFFEANRALDFDREKAYGMKLAIPAGTSVRFEPGQEKEVTLVEFGGKKYIHGFNNLADGSVRTIYRKDMALRKAKELKFKGA
jgi:urease beta subunit